MMNAARPAAMSRTPRGERRLPLLRRHTESFYQDFATGAGRDCALRYEAIRPHIPTDRRLAVLDVGSNMGWFSLRLAQDFDSLVYSIEHWPEDIAFHRRQIDTLGLTNNYQIRALLNRDILGSLFARPEVFDVTLLLSVVHHFVAPFEEWCRLVGQFVAHSQLTLFELPALGDAPDIANLNTFHEWYGRYAGDPYIGLLGDVLRLSGQHACTVETVRGAAATASSKDLRHLHLVRNATVGDDLPRHHCITVAQHPGMHLVFPERQRRDELREDARRFLRSLPRRVGRKLGLPV